MNSFNWRGDESFCDFLKILREDKEVKEAIKPTVREVLTTLQPQEKPGIKEKRIQEGLSELLHEVPGIDDKARRIFQAAFESDLLSVITELPEDEVPSTEAMVEDLSMFLNELADKVLDKKKEKELIELARYFEQHKKDRGTVAAGYLKYFVIPQAIDLLKDEGLWDEEKDEPITPVKKYYESKTTKATKVPSTMQPQEKPDIDAEDYGVEDYSDQDLNKQDAKPKSKSQKDPKYAVRQVPDKEVGNSKMILKDSAEVKEGIFELLGEVPGISLLDQNAVRAAVQAGKISSDWPSEEQMIDDLSKLEDFVDPKKLGPEADIKQEYLKYIIVPKAIIWDKARECKEDIENKRDQIQRYVNQIRNKAKRDYAVVYGEWKLLGELGERPDPSEDLSFMGAQAVRLAIDDIMKSSECVVENLQKPLYLCNNCCKTFRADEAVCPNCLSNIVEFIGKPSSNKLVEKVFGVYGNLRGKGKHFIVDAADKEEAEAKIDRKYPNFKVDVVVEAPEDAEKVEESKLNEQAEWDLTFKYSHDDIHSNPLLDKEGNPWIWARHPIEGKKIRVYSDHQAAWVEKQGAVPVREEPVREEPSEVKPEVASEEPKTMESKVQERVVQVNLSALGIKEIKPGKVIRMVPIGKDGAESGIVEIEGEQYKVQKGVSDKHFYVLKRLSELESKIKEQEAEVKPKSYTISGRGLEELDAKDIANRKGGSVVPDDQNKDKFMVLVGEAKIVDAVGEKIVGKTPSGEEVSVPADTFLNALAKGVGEAGYGHWFASEMHHAEEGTLTFEFISIKAPVVEIVVHGRIEKE